MSFSEANRLGAENIPFLIVVSYDKSEVITIPLDEVEKRGIRFQIGKKEIPKREKDIQFTKKVVSKKVYSEKFYKVIEAIKDGYTYLLNLTQPTEIETTATLEEIYHYADAKYKILVPDRFLCYSPETFIKIEGNQIATFPMKGTISVSIPNGRELLYSNPKENAEHVMVVDLLRNDLNMVARNVRVEKFKHIEKIRSGNRELFQMSSKIVGDLEEGWQSRIGDILEKILPAGSVTGTPKKRTLELIHQIEGYSRNFFTGIFGVFQNGKFDSGVMIRFLEKEGDKLIYKSGGGITLDSSLESEYQEMIEKIYLF